MIHARRRPLGLALSLIIAFVHIALIQLLDMFIWGTIPASIEGILVPLSKFLYIEVTSWLVAQVWNRLYVAPMNCYPIMIIAVMLVACADAYGLGAFTKANGWSQRAVFAVSMLIFENAQ